MIFLRMVSVAPGDSYLHLPDQLHGIDSQTEPLLTLWAERLVEPLEVPWRWFLKPRKFGDAKTQKNGDFTIFTIQNGD